MSLIQDRIVVTRPERVLLSVNARSREAQDYSVVNTIVAEWWVPEGADLVLEPWIEDGVRNQGWRVTRHEAAQVVPDLASDGSVNWKAIAQAFAEAHRCEDPTEATERMAAALDRVTLAEMFEAQPEDPQTPPEEP